MVSREGQYLMMEAACGHSHIQGRPEAAVCCSMVRSASFDMLNAHRRPVSMLSMRLDCVFRCNRVSLSFKNSGLLRWLSRQPSHRSNAGTTQDRRCPMTMGGRPVIHQKQSCATRCKSTDTSNSSLVKPSRERLHWMLGDDRHAHPHWPDGQFLGPSALPDQMTG